MKILTSTCRTSFNTNSTNGESAAYGATFQERDKNLSTVTFSGNFTTLPRRKAKAKFPYYLLLRRDSSNELDRSRIYLRLRSNTRKRFTTYFHRIILTITLYSTFTKIKIKLKCDHLYAYSTKSYFMNYHEEICIKIYILVHILIISLH